MIGFLFNRLGFFMSDIISPFVRLFKFDIHLKLLQCKRLLYRAVRLATQDCGFLGARWVHISLIEPRKYGPKMLNLHGTPASARSTRPLLIIWLLQQAPIDCG